MALKIKATGKTDVGLVRPGNEDYLYLDQVNHVYAVCDGMGGHKAGEIASMLAAETLHTAYHYFPRQLQKARYLDLGRTLPDSGDILLKAIKVANRAIYVGAIEDEEKSGMGTTIVAAAFEADIMCLAHVGDSRAYRLEQDKLTPLTSDHSWLEELKKTDGVTKNETNSFVSKNVITRALGVKENVDVDFRIMKVKPGDTFLLCSDGLCGFVENDEIFEAASDHRDNLQEMLTVLIQLANDRGGTDNITVLAITVEEVKESPLPELDVFTQAGSDFEMLNETDGWVERFADYRQKLVDEKAEDEVVEAGGTKPAGVGLWIIFAIFVAVALAVIYVTHMND